MLFRSKYKISEYAEMVDAVNFESLKSTLRNVEEQKLIPLIGNTLYTKIDQAYESAFYAAGESAMSDADKSLLDRCRAVIGPYLAYFYSAKAELKLSDAGLRREETNTSKTAYQYQVKIFRDACLSEAMAQSEILLQFLEDNKATYTDWVTDNAFKLYRSLFIKTGGEFAQYFSSHSPYLNYWAMRPKMINVEEMHMRPLLGDALYEGLKIKDQAAIPSFTAKETTLLQYIRYAVAYFTVSFSVPYLNVRIADNGLTVVSASARASSDDVAARSAAQSADINLLINSSADTAKKWVEKIKNYLDKNHEDFPLYEYTQPSHASGRCHSGSASFGLT